MLSSPPLWLILVAFVCMLGPLVFFHELGHYSVARLFGIPAETFSIGFGRELFGWTDRRGTRWKVGWLPLGGYVKFVGDMSPASDPAALESVPEELRDKVFQVRPAWQRFLVVLAGPAANFLIAIAIFAGVFASVGMPDTDNRVLGVKPGSVAAQAGIRPGDRIVAIASRATSSFEEVSNYVIMRPDERAVVSVARNGRTIDLPLTIAAATEQDRFGQRFRVGRIGVLGGVPTHVKIPIARLIPEATLYTIDLTRRMVEGLWQIISGRRSVSDLSGPIKIAQVAGQTASLGLSSFILLIALFSINLGFINLLPVPMLDGGHLLFYGVEAVRRRPLSAQALEWSFRGGLAVIFALMVFTTLNDLGSLGLWDRLQRLIG